MRHFLHSIKVSYLVESVKTWGQSTVQTEDLILNNCSKWQVIKQIGQEFPNVCIAVLSHALIIEAVNLGDLSAFVVTSQNRKSVWVSHFEAN
jgi:hypothetical protein